ncbi:MAG: UDP-N-acetylmuramoyl-L-alanyl-D-glutamate--2,6-diaminopimelate ligase [Oceanipulchritudo sp.]
MKPATIDLILDAVQPERVEGFAPVTVEAVACHPSEVTGESCLFVCMDEYLEYNRWQTWRTHLEQLPGLKISVLVAPEPVEGLAVPQLITPEPRKALGRVARLLHDQPDLGMEVHGVTGTNGKTTTTRLIAHLFGRLGVSCGSIGTLGMELTGAIRRPGTYTTPLAHGLYQELEELKEAGAEAVAMEVSSHGLALDRVEGLVFQSAILTNVGRDHLDFHGTREAYVEAKRRLFRRVKASGWCILNRFSPLHDDFAAACSGTVRSYGPAGSGAGLELLEVELHPGHSLFRLRRGGESELFETRLVGGFQVENAMAAISLLDARGFSLEAIAGALRDFPPVCGRMERMAMPNGCTAIVDYAHNPDGLKNLLENCRLLCRGRLHLVFGCGGDRDKGKRSLMGALAAEMADVVWITSDNPRTEEPESIIRDILEGIPGSGQGTRAHRIVDRKEAIQAAYRATREEDVLVVAGKGHEDYQIVGLVKHPFSDQEILRGLGGR